MTDFQNARQFILDKLRAHRDAHAVKPPESRLPTYRSARTPKISPLRSSFETFSLGKLAVVNSDEKMTLVRDFKDGVHVLISGATYTVFDPSGVHHRLTFDGTDGYGRLMFVGGSSISAGPMEIQILIEYDEKP